MKEPTHPSVATLALAFLVCAGMHSPAFAERINAGPVWEVGSGVEYVSVTYDPADEASTSGWGGQPVFFRGSLIGALTRSWSDGKWMFGDYLALGAGGWYGDQGYLRVPLDVGLQAGMVVADEFQVVARGGVMGIGTSGSSGAGGFGAYFYSLRGKWEDYALEGGFALREDTEDESAAGVQFITGRWYVSDINLGVRFMNATRLAEPQTSSTSELTDRSVLIFISMEI